MSLVSDSNISIQSVKQRFGIIGNSPLLDRALSTAVRVAATDLTVLISGESGVGKEVFSKIIHALSTRKHEAFIAVNCGAIPSGTINSELFGHEKGSFTGASGERKGYFETVDGGTIFLDEVGELPLDTQAFLLRILESGEFLRVGSSKVLKTDVRIIAATNVQLEEQVSRGKFREDLFYRLSTVPIRVPALKDRREDISMLFRKFASDFAEKYRTEPVRLDEQAQQLLMSYRWPGNIRELKNVAEQLSVLAEDRRIYANDLLQLIPNIAERNLPAIRPQDGAGTMQEREILYKLLFEMKGDLNDLKNLVFELIRHNKLRVPDINNLQQLSEAMNFEPLEHFMPDAPVTHAAKPISYREDGNLKPILLDHSEPGETSDEPEVEESLSIEDMEKTLIQRALKKHEGRRKDAAIDLGISERTLYRKIKQYEL
jgi:DNA-binding NtrC family response regulator